MARRALGILTVVSTALLVVAILLLLAGYALRPRFHYVSISDSLHVGLEARGFDSRSVFFNDATGPYRGSIIGLLDSDGNLVDPLEREWRFGDAWGVYYRYFQWPDRTLWTLSVSLWYPIVLFAMLPALRLLLYTRRSRAEDAA
jgi:hypothetical protein